MFQLTVDDDFFNVQSKLFLGFFLEGQVKLYVISFITNSFSGQLNVREKPIEI